jgi:hypothetical protein
MVWQSRYFLQSSLHEALAAFLAVLDRDTPADVVAPRRCSILFHLLVPCGR